MKKISKWKREKRLKVIKKFSKEKKDWLKKASKESRPRLK